MKRLCYDDGLPSGGSSRRERTSPLSPYDLYRSDELYHISTIGWTKCYQKGILAGYNEMMREYFEEVIAPEYGGLPNVWRKLTKYEDFPDILALMQRDARICAVAKNSVLFRKSDNSVTTNVSPDNYDVQIPTFLRIAREVSIRQKDKIIDEKGEPTVDKLTAYKFVQYLNVVWKKTSEGSGGHDDALDSYSCDRFYRSFIETVFGISRAESGGSSPLTKANKSILNRYHRQVERIFSGPDYNIFGDLYVKKNASWQEICDGYKLTKLRT